jgi:hypothetical protein
MCRKFFPFIDFENPLYFKDRKGGVGGGIPKIRLLCPTQLKLRLSWILTKRTALNECLIAKHIILKKFKLGG